MNLNKVSPGHYETADGKYSIVQADAYSVCSRSHGMGRRGGACPGGQKHPVVCWDVYRTSNNKLVVEWASSKREAVWALGVHLNKQRQVQRLRLRTRRRNQLQRQVAA